MSRSHRAPLLIALLALTAACSPSTSEPAASAPAIDCRPDISAGDCAQAKASLQQDASVLSAQAATAPVPVNPQGDDSRAATLMAAECQLQEQVLAALQRRQRGEGDIITEEERAQVPAEIERSQAYLDANCK